ncbi:hypothetical protein INT47_005114 [Mucor saturninus]|uniref:Uncharacterized protein n=1 Tax=Mucor saturninus TaxID=64648 RepID=A0A8H7QWK0_9FUNG|nr:hypothetical protein INT47_005114 [Mucor saturninus]
MEPEISQASPIEHEVRQAFQMEPEVYQPVETEHGICQVAKEDTIAELPELVDEERRILTSFIPDLSSSHSHFAPLLIVIRSSVPLYI